MSVYMNVILENLYLGSVESSKDTEKLNELGITHILTVDVQALFQETCDTFVTKHINLPDLAESDLLTYFEECNEFINEGREKGSVLVHCFAGVSRSATLVLAYIMNKSNISFDEALSIVKTQRPIVSPNEGFKQQLRLYEGMGCKIDPQSNSYRQYRLIKLSRAIQAGVYQGQIPDDVLNNHIDNRPNLNVYKCRKCRHTLFKSSSLLSHSVGAGESSFDWRCKLGRENGDGAVTVTKDDTPCDQSLFIEPMKWMLSYLKNMDGKIPCPKCSAKLGSFVWYGERCPCGTWVAPAFHIQASKVDVCVTNLRLR
ncbi:dual specificity protein phosphatase 12 [Patella vulgata]|uniref:dual specificity protein phosphatase 12 n=1 Tax=Patella vulgata TaxID=6465 RepID=UPI00217FB2B6|nr:dual specificity protein phosphatase 12 [Patella vulgata]